MTSSVDPIRALAGQVEVTHSAMSQTVTAMRRAGLVDSAPGRDARTRTVALTERGRALVPFLEDEWRATEQAWAEREREIPYAPNRGGGRHRRAGARSFLGRISTQVVAPPA